MWDHYVNAEVLEADCYILISNSPAFDVSAAPKKRIYSR